MLMVKFYRAPPDMSMNFSCKYMIVDVIKNPISGSDQVNNLKYERNARNSTLIFSLESVFDG